MAMDIKKYLEQMDQIDDPSLHLKLACPSRNEVVALIKLCQVIMFPCYYQYQGYQQAEALETLEEKLIEQINYAMSFDAQECCMAKQYAQTFLEELLTIKRMLLTDLQAIYDGDPAAKSKKEIILSYPGFYAISIYRLAHALFKMNIPYLPRMMSEFAHEKTGIDIHPGAKIKEYFCIDHGTGIVIGETCEIGHHVKIYQGVTLGAKSFDLDENGHPKKSGKRHPNIGNHVVIYANATILGGQTIVGDRCVIGGNVWLTESVEANQILYFQK